MTGARKGSSGPFATSDDVLNASGVAGADVTAALDALLVAVAALQAAVALLQPAPIVSQIGWASNANSNVLELLPAGHAPGQYEVAFTLIVRTGVAANCGPTVTWTSPTFGSESKALGSGMQLNSTGTSSIITGTQNTPMRCFALLSTGATPIALQVPTTGVAGGVADIYASARLIAA